MPKVSNRSINNVKILLKVYYKDNKTGLFIVNTEHISN